MGETPKTLNCARCGKPLVLMLPPGGSGPRMPTCLQCDDTDPITSPAAMGWLAGELRPPKG